MVQNGVETMQRIAADLSSDLTLSSGVKFVLEGQRLPLTIDHKRHDLPFFCKRLFLRLQVCLAESHTPSYLLALAEWLLLPSLQFRFQYRQH